MDFKLCAYESPGRSRAHEFGVLTCSQVMEMLLIQRSRFANHWAGAQEANEKEGMGSKAGPYHEGSYTPCKEFGLKAVVTQERALRIIVTS